MNFAEAIAVCFKKYVGFSGRARRAEYWFWILFTFIVSICTMILDSVIFPGGPEPLNGVWTVATFLPTMAVTARRLHDIDRTAWWMLLWLVPLIGWAIMVYWHVQSGTDGANRFGPDPLADEAAVDTPASA